MGRGSGGGRLGLIACDLMRVPAFALLLALTGHQSVSAAPKVRPIDFIQDDYAKALEEARSRKVPIFIDAWAPW